MMRFFTKLNIVFTLQLTAVICAVLGILPREIFLFSGAIIVFFVLFSTLEESLYLLARTIPLFVALPITDTFDSLNIWRIVVLIMFLRLALAKPARVALADAFSRLRAKTRIGIGAAYTYAYRTWTMEFLLTALLLVSALSLLGADNIVIGAKRIIFFANLWMLFFVTRAVVTRENLPTLAFNVFLSGIIVVAVGAIQLLLAYTMFVDDFSNFWALQVNRVLYGDAWAHIAIAANTWFAYYSGTIHLRMFSSFPDSHSFPLFLLMAISFVMTPLLITQKGSRMRLALWVWLFLAAFETVLSGTRGIWASALFPAAFIAYLAYRRFITAETVKLAGAPLALFLFCLPLSAVIFNSTQFLLAESTKTSAVLSERIKSIIDLGETSNHGRIAIWEASLKSAARHPLLGVGVGNFPSVLNLDPSAIKAGASAHNMYLNFLAESGLFGLLIFLLIVYEMGKRAWDVFVQNRDRIVKFFAFNWLIYYIWILWYSMTDVALFDERPFLLFMLFAGALYSYKTYHETTTSGIH